MVGIIEHECPICGETSLLRYGGRPQGRCASCGALERTRVIYALFRKLDLLKSGKRILHIAPERALVQPFTHQFKTKYSVADIREEALSHIDAPAEKIVLDVTNLPARMERRRFDVVLHSHILEHVRASWPLTLLRMDTLVRDGGYHIFSIPIKREWSCEDLAELTPEQRKKRFGQHDHVRYIGRRDFEASMQSIKRLIKPEYYRRASDFLTEREMKAMAGDRDVFVIKKRARISRAQIQ